MISINVSELIWTVINFLLLLFLLNRFLFKPVTTFMADRQARIDAGLRKEQDAKDEIEKNNERLLEEKARSREEARQLLTRNTEELEAYSAETLREAKKTAVQNRKEKEEALKEKQEKTGEELRQSAPELAAILAERLLDEE